MDTSKDSKRRRLEEGRLVGTQGGFYCVGLNVQLLVANFNTEIELHLCFDGAD